MPKQKSQPRSHEPTALPLESEAPVSPHPEVHQLQIVHLSDIHFGSSHNYNAVRAPSGGDLPQAGICPFSKILFQDLASGDPNCPTFVAFTGDVTTKHEDEGFKQAGPFFQALSKTVLGGKKRGLDAIIAVPGNHDINFDVDDPHEKWLRWTRFYNKLFKTKIKPESPLQYVRLIDRSKEGYCVLTLNSEVHIRKGSEDQFRGQVDEPQLRRVNELLDQHKQSLARSIRVALIHHHPVLIPSLVEPDRSYDAVLRAGDLLNILNKYGFHLILHGHKHWPCTFTVDNRNAYDMTFVRPMLIVAGGSLGSCELPNGVDTNCYNRILVKWNSDTDECRIQVNTRGLIKVDENRTPFPTRDQWYWRTLRVDDRTFYRYERIPPTQLDVSDWRKGPGEFEAARQDEYDRLRGNMPVVEVRPSFQPFQKYEAVFWIVPHQRKAHQTPVSVTWSAGKRFPVYCIAVEKIRDSVPSMPTTDQCWYKLR